MTCFGCLSLESLRLRKTTRRHTMSDESYASKFHRAPIQPTLNEESTTTVRHCAVEGARVGCDIGSIPR